MIEKSNRWVIDSLEMAIKKERPNKGLRVHTDQGRNIRVMILFKFLNITDLSEVTAIKVIPMITR